MTVITRNRRRKMIEENNEDPFKVQMNSTSKRKSWRNRLMCGFSKSDLQSILLLIFLYILQGIPLGLSGAVPYILQSRQADYKAQATFSFAFWPFSMKLLWAPVIDSCTINRFGRRKSWLIPLQYLIGITMLLTSMRVTDWLGETPANLNSTTHERMSPPVGVNSTGHAESKSMEGLEIYKMTAAFFTLTFLAASQDVVVDGWALTMLSRENVGWASTCNSVGQTVGYFIAFIFFLALESAEFCNTWLRSTPKPYGIVTFSGFLVFWGIVFIVSTTLVMLFKSEKGGIYRANESDAANANGRDGEHSPTNNRSVLSSTTSLNRSPDLLERRSNASNGVGDDSPDDDLENEARDSLLSREITIETKDTHVQQIRIKHEMTPSENSFNDEVEELDLGLIDTYKYLFKIIRLRPIILYVIVLFTLKFGFSAADSVSGLKLIEKGVSKERLAILGVALVPVQTILPLVISKHATGPKPLSLYFNAALPRTLMSFIFAYCVYTTPNYKQEDGSYPLYYYGVLFAVYVVHQMFAYTMFVTQMAFHAKISDPVIGGTYMTLLNTASNLAGTLPGTLVLYLVDPLSSKICTSGKVDGSMCNSKELLQACTSAGGTCITHFDGYYLEVGVCTVVGLIGAIGFRPLAKRLQSHPMSTWCVTGKSNKSACCKRN